MSVKTSKDKIYFIMDPEIRVRKKLSSVFKCGILNPLDIVDIVTVERVWD
eukprot:CAMPEP_0176470514 /NCGR_PEP_ID=MMETSP0127-20121128/40498_1 /TAXON_ID=938130 /ORGANISM="Platyophrya macrostoma, Strain WH" /LENGTH=49 /DNA_ID=CAMNT_0017864817 /DNA_START=123 /DNA_END=272 /DNA_ORIENTATION=-